MSKHFTSLMAGCLSIGSIINSSRLSLEDEKKLQAQIAEKFKEKNVPFEREYFLDKENILDFFVGNEIGVEVKLKGSAMAIYRQCERYCKFEKVQALMLVTNKSMTLPAEINGKWCFVLNLSDAWL